MINEELSEGLGAHSQPTNAELLAALAAAGEPFADAARVALWRLRLCRTTWFDADDMALRRRIDQYLDASWITDRQSSLVAAYGATCCGCLHGSGAIYVFWTDGRKCEFHVTDSDATVRAKLRGIAGIDDVRELLVSACAPNVELTCPPRAGHRSNDER